MKKQMVRCPKWEECEDTNGDHYEEHNKNKDCNGIYRVLYECPPCKPVGKGGKNK